MMIVIFYMSSKFLDKKAHSHQRILEAASREVRRYGFRGTRVADVMKEAGMVLEPIQS